jgi:hypothetical protein
VRAEKSARFTEAALATSDHTLLFGHGIGDDAYVTGTYGAPVRVLDGDANFCHGEAILRRAIKQEVARISGLPVDLEAAASRPRSACW